MKKTFGTQFNPIKMVDKNGNEHLFDILLTFRSDDYDRSYILLYPINHDHNSEVHIQAYALGADDDPTNPQGGNLIEIKDDKEWDMVESVLNTFTSNDHE